MNSKVEAQSCFIVYLKMRVLFKFYHVSFFKYVGFEQIQFYCLDHQIQKWKFC